MDNQVAATVVDVVRRMVNHEVDMAAAVILIREWEIIHAEVLAAGAAGIAMMRIMVMAIHPVIAVDGNTTAFKLALIYLNSTPGIFMPGFFFREW